MSEFNPSWWLFFLFALCIDWGMIRIIRRVEPHKFRTPHWMAGAYGDLFLPLGFASSVSIAYASFDPHAWYSSVAWGVFLLGLSLILIIALNVHHDRVRSHHSVKRRKHALLAPHEIWHDIVFVVLFFMISTSAVPFLLAPKSLGIIVAAIVGYGGWAATQLYDFAYPPVDKPMGARKLAPARVR